MLHRRQFLRAVTALSPVIAPASLAAPSVMTTSPPLRLLQVMDSSADQQEQVRDYAAGLQAAVQAANRNNGAGQREVLVQPFHSDGTAASLQALVQRLRGDSGLSGLTGTVSERLSLAVIAALAQAGLDVPHVAPWLADSRYDELPQLVNLFASRETQLRQTLGSLDAMGLRQLGLVYDSPQTRATVHPELSATLERLALKPPVWTAPDSAGIERLVQQLPGGAPPVLTFAGGAIELARFVQALAARPLNRYVVSLADADLGLLNQLGATRRMPLVLTQVVPNPRSHAAPFVRKYRELHARLYDDTPSPAGLAGYVAGRYTVHLAQRLGSAAGRGALLDEVRRRPDADIDGYALQFGNGRTRGSGYVTQTLLSRDGRLIG